MYHFVPPPRWIKASCFVSYLMSSLYRSLCRYQWCWCCHWVNWLGQNDWISQLCLSLDQLLPPRLLVFFTQCLYPCLALCAMKINTIDAWKKKNRGLWKVVVEAKRGSKDSVDIPCSNKTHVVFYLLNNPKAALIWLCSSLEFAGWFFCSTLAQFDLK